MQKLTNLRTQSCRRTWENISDPPDPGPAVLQGLEVLEEQPEAVAGRLHLVAGDGLALLLPRQDQVHLQDGAEIKWEEQFTRQAWEWNADPDPGGDNIEYKNTEKMQNNW